MNHIPKKYRKLVMIFSIVFSITLIIVSILPLAIERYFNYKLMGDIDDIHMMIDDFYTNVDLNDVKSTTENAGQLAIVNKLEGELDKFETRYTDSYSQYMFDLMSTSYEDIKYLIDNNERWNELENQRVISINNTILMKQSVNKLAEKLE